MTWSDCITWPGRLTSGGYVQVWRDGRPQSAHRLIWEDMHGPIPQGLVVDHVCRNRACLNTAHFQLVTLGENSRLGGTRKTHCKNGHPFDEENTFYYKPSGGRRVGRGCRICRAASAKRYRAKAEAA